MRNIALTIAVLLFILPAACSGLASVDGESIGGPVNISVTSFCDGAVVYIDVVPPHVAVVGEVSAPSGIESVLVLSDKGRVSCGNETKFACSVPVSAGENIIMISAVDNLGNRAEKRMNVTVRIGMPPPLPIRVTGRVTDPEGNPVPGATVVFVSDIGLTVDNDPLSVTATTGNDGSYLIENAIGHQQNVSVQKEGYLLLNREIFFENQLNEYDLELVPQGTAAPGFSFGIVICALLGVSVFLRAGRH